MWRHCIVCTADLGELERLRDAWREAERIARISDALLPPRGWEAFRRRVSGGPEEGR